MDRLKNVNDNAWAYLNKLDPSAWVKAYFSHHCKVDSLTNNMCEVWNSKIIHYRTKPILTMSEELRCYIMQKMAGHKKVLGSYIRKIAPVQQKRLDKLKVDSNKWSPVRSGDDKHTRFKVHHHLNKLAVNLELQTCTCNVWQLTDK